MKHIDEQYDELRIKCDQKDEEILQLKTERKELVSGCGILISGCGLIVTINRLKSAHSYQQRRVN